MVLQDLVKEIKNGSVAAQQCLFNQLSGKLLVLCRRFIKNREDAEERMLDGFYKFFRNIDAFQFKSDNELYAFIKKIMINECLAQLRLKEVFCIVSESLAADIPLEENLLDDLSAKEIFSFVALLPVGCRTVFNLAVIEEMDHSEIATLLGISEGTSWSQLSRAKILLQKMLSSKNTDHVNQRSK